MVSATGFRFDVELSRDFVPVKPGVLTCSFVQTSALTSAVQSSGWRPALLSASGAAATPLYDDWRL
jgi:hypothetical protein